MNNQLLILLVALCVNEFIHNIFELWGINQKIDWLRANINNKNYASWPINIDNGKKTVALHTSLLIVIVALTVLILNTLKLSSSTLIALAVVVLILNYIYFVWKTDRIHANFSDIQNQIKK